MNVEFNRNEDQLKQLSFNLSQKFQKVALGGGEKRIAAHKARGKLTARERIAYLLDKGAAQVEIGAFAGEGMYKEEGGCPGGGVVVVISYVAGRQEIGRAHV